MGSPTMLVFSLLSMAMPHPVNLISLGNGAEVTSTTVGRYYRPTPGRFISTDETMSLSAHGTTDNGGTVAATAVLTGDCRTGS